ncbi:hypothetical protein SAMN04487847_0441 [Microbacterium sp. cf332]|nr:hypothetical protein SAMN04487847_0441 [Microbacterium sp. cf332]
MRDSVQAIRDMKYIHLGGDAVFTLGSIGVEKTMKLMLGCAAVNQNARWPSKAELKAWGHDIERLSELLAATISSGIGRATAQGYAEQLAGRIANGELLPLIFATLARYGRSGRFHHLDILATDEPGQYDDPADYWRSVEAHVEARAEFRDIPYGDNAALDAYESRLRAFIAEEMDVWWFCLHRLGVQGCFGDLGEKIGWEIWETGRPTPARLDL